MSLAEPCAWSVLRCLLLVACCLPIADSLAASRWRYPRLFWSVALVPFFTPGLLIAYSYANFGLSLIHYPLLNEVVYALLVGMRCVPISALAIKLLPPPPISAAALYVSRLSRPDVSLSTRIGFALRGPLRRFLPAAGVIFWLSFQEFEIAALMLPGTDALPTSWTVRLYDARAAGVELSAILAGMLLPIMLQLAGIVLLIQFGRLSRGLAGARADLQRSQHTVSAGWVAVSVIAVTIIPLVLNSRDLAGGISLLTTQSSILHRLLVEILYTLGFALTAALAADLLAGRLVRSWQSSQLGKIVTIVCCVPGTTGSLVWSLTLIGLFQLPGLRAVYDTPLPLLLGLTFFILPVSLLLRILLTASRAAEPLHLADLLRQSENTRQQSAGRTLALRMRFAPRFLSLAIPFYLSYWNLPATTLLAPVRMGCAPAEIYNLMHYRQAAGLTAMTLLTIAAPLLLAAVAWSTRRWWA